MTQLKRMLSAFVIFFLAFGFAISMAGAAPTSSIDPAAIMAQDEAAGSTETVPETETVSEEPVAEQPVAAEPQQAEQPAPPPPPVVEQPAEQPVQADPVVQEPVAEEPQVEEPVTVVTETESTEETEVVDPETEAATEESTEPEAEVATTETEVTAEESTEENATTSVVITSLAVDCNGTVTFAYSSGSNFEAYSGIYSVQTGQRIGGNGGTQDASSSGSGAIGTTLEGAEFNQLRAFLDIVDEDGNNRQFGPVFSPMCGETPTEEPTPPTEEPTPPTEEPGPDPITFRGESGVSCEGINIDVLGGNDGQWYDLVIKVDGESSGNIVQHNGSRPTSQFVNLDLNEGSVVTVHIDGASEAAFSGTATGCDDPGTPTPEPASLTISSFTVDCFGAFSLTYTYVGNGDYSADVALWVERAAVDSMSVQLVNSGESVTVSDSFGLSGTQGFTQVKLSYTLDNGDAKDVSGSKIAVADGDCEVDPGTPTEEPEVPTGEVSNPVLNCDGTLTFTLSATSVEEGSQVYVAAYFAHGGDPVKFAQFVGNGEYSVVFGKVSDRLLPVSFVVGVADPDFTTETNLDSFVIEECEGADPGTPTEEPTETPAPSTETPTTPEPKPTEQPGENPNPTKPTHPIKVGFDALCDEFGIDNDDSASTSSDASDSNNGSTTVSAMPNTGVGEDLLAAMEENRAAVFTIFAGMVPLLALVGWYIRRSQAPVRYIRVG